jgi:hypothetical protein
MLDPLTAIGFASSIAQLIDFSANLLKQASDIRTKGSSVEVSHLKTLTIDLVNLKEVLEKRSRPDALNKDGSLAMEEEVRCKNAFALNAPILIAPIH